MRRISLSQLFHRREKGVTAAEFAMLSPMVLLMMLGTAECGLMYFTQHLMESAAFNAARAGKTGYTETGATREQTIINTIHQYAGFYLDMQAVKLSSKVYKQFGDVGSGEPYIDANGNDTRDDGENFTDLNGNGEYDSDVGSAGQGGERDIVMYTIDYPWKVTTPFLQNIIGDDKGIVPLQARLVVRNEPFGATN